MVKSTPLEPNAQRHFATRTGRRTQRDEEERRRQSREAQRRLRARGANTLKKRIFPPAGTPAAEAAAQKWAEIEAREPNELPVVPETGIPITGEEVGNCE